MEIASTTAINIIDLINLSKDIAQLNLGYLGISVAILGVLGGIFVYFNIKPFKDTLEKQEKKIDNLKEKADKLLDQSREQSEKALENFKKEQTSTLSVLLEDRLNNARLETENKIIELNKSLLEKTGTISEDGDIKLKELILSEVTNRVGALEKSLLSEIKNSKETLEEMITETSKGVSFLKTVVKEVESDIKELKVYRYAQEGKMGAIIYSIELLKDDIDNKVRNGWRIPSRLGDLKNNIKGCSLDPDYITQIEEQLARIEGEKKYSVLIKEVRDQYSGKQ